MLTENAVRAARPRPRAYKRFDERGLFLFVAPSGLKSWRWRFRWEGREQLLTLGAWPEVSLADARGAAEAARRRLDAGNDPRRQSESAVRLEAIARHWHTERAPRWSEAHAADVLASLVRDVFPEIGGRTPDSIEPAELIALLRSIEARGAVETARRVRQRLEMIYDFAIARNQATRNPARMIAAELAPARAARGHPAITDPVRLAELFAAIAAIAAPARPASLFLALTAARCGSIERARVGELSGLDGDAPLWRIPAANLKLKKARKADAAADLLVPLSHAAAAIARDAAAGRDPAALLFPDLSEGAIRRIHLRAGAGGDHVPHGWRASFSTILNERRPVDRDAIDRALGHAGRDKVEAAYNRSTQMSVRRALFEDWGALIAPGWGQA